MKTKREKRKKALENVLIICFSCLLCVGCVTLEGKRKGKDEWPTPSQPVTKSVKIILVKNADVKENGFYIDKEDAQNLVDNLDELKSYIKKMESQIEKMKKYYGIK